MSPDNHFLLEYPPINRLPLHGVFRQIPSGEFVMGSLNGLPHAPESPPHLVSVPQFWMADTMITVGQYLSVMGNSPEQFSRDFDLPVDSVSRLAACAFCSKLCEITSKQIRLPTESEWEYACRAGSTTQYHFGDSPARLAEFAWFESNSQGRSAHVRQKLPNAWGLHDMIGNLWEWCLDSWHGEYTGAPCDGSAWIETKLSGQKYCVRGGAWDMDAFRCRSSYRSYDLEDTATSRNGFRIVCDL